MSTQRKDYAEDAIVNHSSQAMRSITNLNAPHSIQASGADRLDQRLTNYNNIKVGDRILLGNREEIVKEVQKSEDIVTNVHAVYDSGKQASETNDTINSYYTLDELKSGSMVIIKGIEHFLPEEEAPTGVVLAAFTEGQAQLIDVSTDTTRAFKIVRTSDEAILDSMILTENPFTYDFENLLNLGLADENEAFYMGSNDGSAFKFASDPLNFNTTLTYIRNNEMSEPPRSIYLDSIA